MNLLNAKCPFCGREMKIELNIEKATCTNCGKSFDAEQAIKYYKSINKIEAQNTLFAHTEVFSKIESLYEQATFYIKNEDYSTARELLNECLSLNANDYRLYLSMVYVCTKNFTDLKDETHVNYLAKAIEIATPYEKQKIKKLYSGYHTKRNLTKEELEDYDKQKEAHAFSVLEERLKECIPKHFAREKKLLPLKIFMIISFILCVACAICISTGLQVVFVGLTAVFAVLFIIFLSSFTTAKTKSTAFNGALDLFDNYKLFKFSTQESLTILKFYNEYALACKESASDIRLKALFDELIGVFLSFKNENFNAFISSHSTLKKYAK